MPRETLLDAFLRAAADFGLPAGWERAGAVARHRCPAGWLVTVGLWRPPSGRLLTLAAAVPPGHADLPAAASDAPHARDLLRRLLDARLARDGDGSEAA